MTENCQMLRAKVGIIGSGPAGIVLANILHDQGISCVVIDHYNREEIYRRGRAGVLESTTVASLSEHGLADTILQRGLKHSVSEFRFPGYSLEIDYSQYVGGEYHTIYSQSQLNDDLIERFLQRRGDLRFWHEAEALDIQAESVAIMGSIKQPDERFRLDCELAISCDGYHGLGRRCLPMGAAEIYDKQYPYRWLAILAHADPSSHHVIYCLHPDGFGAYVPRSQTISRYYLQVEVGETLDQWPDARIWDELDRRLKKESWKLHRGNIFDKSILEMRSYVMEPMHHGRLLFAGDSAHIITPAGGKGMNLAIHDAIALAKHIRIFFEQGHPVSYFQEYSNERLPLIWRAQDFSRSMIHMLHKASGVEPGAERFLNKISESKLLQLRDSPTFMRDFARNYVGII